MTQVFVCVSTGCAVVGPLCKKRRPDWGQVFVSSAATPTQPEPRSHFFSPLSGQIPVKSEDSICAALKPAKGDNTESPVAGLMKIVFLPGMVSTVRFSLI